jgi:hypothetical protein
MIDRMWLENEVLHNDTLQDWRKNTQCYIWRSIKCDLKRKFLKMIHYKIGKKNTKHSKWISIKQWSNKVMDCKVSICDVANERSWLEEKKQHCIWRNLAWKENNVAIINISFCQQSYKILQTMKIQATKGSSISPCNE